MAKTHRISEIKSSEINAMFPELPGYEAEWAPVYWEPIMLSGERITALVAAVSQAGEMMVDVVLRPGVLKVLYPGQHKKALNLLLLVKESLEDYLHTEGRLEGWTCPLSGFYMGDIFPGLSTSISGIIAQAKPLCSSLSGAIDLDQYERPDSSEYESHEKWRGSIKGRVKEMLPRLGDCFAKSFVIMEGARKTDIDFVGPRLAANFGRIVPGNLSRSLRDAKAQVLDLAALRDQMTAVNNNEKFMLMIWAPSRVVDGHKKKQIDNSLEACLELESEAMKVGLSVESFGSSDQVARKICEIEVAA